MSSATKILDKSLFNATWRFLALSIPSKRTQEIRSKLSPLLLNKPRVNCVHRDEKDASRRVLLLSDELGNEVSKIPQEHMDWIKQQKDLYFTDHSINVNYDYYSTEEVLTRLLPSGVEIPSAYEQVGHLIHLNLRDELLPYKFIIGQVLLDKVGGCKTVINKVGKIDTVFRTFDMELLAGEDNTLVTVSEENCSFEFDYKRVYWNSKLHAEHTRLTQSFTPSDVVLDLFCGVGPFAIPAGKMGCCVHANDLNPDSITWLKKNIHKNKVTKQVTAYNMDARDCYSLIRSLGIPVTQIIMNLPVSAEMFCDMFCEQVNKSVSDSVVVAVNPIVHCYMFSNSDDPESDCIQRIESVMKTKLLGNVKTKLIRDVAPKKMMVLVSFELTQEMIYGNSGNKRDIEEASGSCREETKKSKVV